MRSWLRLAGVTAFAVSVGAASAHTTPAQAPSLRADGAISGVVTDGSSGRPVAEAAVILSGGPRVPFVESDFRHVDLTEARRVHLTDSQGRFVFTDLAAGSGYGISVTKAGFVDGAYGNAGPQSPSSPRIALVDGQWLPNVQIAIWRHGSISGAVTDERGDPIAGVFVRVLSYVRVAGLNHLAAGAVALTDDRGRYRVARLPPGTYLVMIPNVQMSLPSTTTAEVAAGQRPMVTAAVGAGRSLSVLDPTMDIDDNTRVVIAGFPLPPQGPGGQRLAYPMAFPGGAASISEFVPIELAGGAERTGVDFRLSPVPAARIHGVVDGPVEARANLTLRLLLGGLEELSVGSEVATALVADDGSFAFAPVPVGTYTIDAPETIGEYSMSVATPARMFDPRLPRPPGLQVRAVTLDDPSAGPSAPRSAMLPTISWNRSARVRIVVDGPVVPPVVVPLEPGPTVSGRMQLDLDPNHPFTPEALRNVVLEPANGSARLRTHGSSQRRDTAPDEFALTVLPGPYLFRSAGAAFMIKSVMLDGRDYAQTPLEVSSGRDVSGLVVTFTNAVPTLSGVVRDRQGAVTSAAVIAFPVEPDQWVNYSASPVRIRSTLTSGNGAYRLAALPAGDYFVVAVAPSQAGAWRDPEFLKRTAPLATRVSIGWGEARFHDLVAPTVR